MSIPARVFSSPLERLPYVVFFIGMLLTAVGSSYYHLEPDNERLFWDRLPMTIAFMSLIAAQMTERVSVRAGITLLGPMLPSAHGPSCIGADRAHGRWQRHSVRNLAGLLRRNLMLIALLLPSRYTRERDIYWVFAWYVIAKILETIDAYIFRAREPDQRPHA